MGCDFPIKAYRSAEVGPNGKRLLTFNPLKAINSTSPFEIPCNRCTGCKLEYARQWHIRMSHEAKLYDQNCCITLTYSNEHVPTDYSVRVRDWQLFMKRFRKKVRTRVRFFAAGEYGDNKGRPHYHAILFNYDFADKVLETTSSTGVRQYSSKLLEEIWPFGHCTVGDADNRSMAYVARYVQKKQHGKDDRAANYYYRQSPIDGNWYTVHKEFAVMSRRPGIGAGFFDQYRSDLYPSGTVVVDGREQSLPRFYLSKLSEEEQEDLKRKARKASLKFKEHTTMERRLARAAVRDARIKPLNQRK